MQPKLSSEGYAGSGLTVDDLMHDSRELQSILDRTLTWENLESPLS
jgi:hypothetical protein